MTGKKYFPWKHFILLILFSLPLFFIKITNQQTWGDDFAQYIQEAKNISEGKAYYASSYIFNDLNKDYAPAEYPPGFPLLLSPVVKAFGLHIAPMLYLISFLLFCLSCVLFFYFRKFISNTASVCLALIIVYCAGVLNLKGYVLSDLPLLLLTAIYFLLRSELKLSFQRILLLSFVVTFSILTRSQAAIILAAEGLWIFFELCRGRFQKTSWQKIKPALFICIGAVGLYFIVQKIFLRAANDPLLYYASFFKLYEGNFWLILKDNLNILFGMFSELFVYHQDNKIIQFFSQILTYVFLFLALIGCGIQIKRGPRTEFYFFILMCLLIILLPVRQGLRFFIPVLPAYLFLVCTGWKVFQTKLNFISGSKLAMGASALYLLSGLHNFGSAPFENWTPYTAKDSIAFEYLKQTIKQGEVIVFTKPRALALFTNLSAINIAWRRSAADNKRKFDSVDVKYMLTRKDLDWNLLERYLQEVPAKDSITIADVYTLYRMK